MFCKDVNKNDFKASYVIYNCNITTMKFKIKEWDNKKHTILIIKHEFDSDYMLLAFEEFE